MKLHANAPPRPEGQGDHGQACPRARDRAHGGGRGRRSKREDRRQMGAPLPGRGRVRLARSQLRAEARPQRDHAGAGRGDRRPAAGATDRPGDRRDAGDADLDRLCRAQANRPRQAGPPLSAEPARRADPHRRQEARPDRGGAGHRATGKRHYNPKRGLRGHEKRMVGWERVHVCVDDATRLAYVEVLPDEKAKTVVGFLRRAVGFYRSHEIAVEGLMTDNGPPYRSAVHALACRALGIKHIRTQPYRPQTNGKAERFIRTMLQEWAYAAVYGSSPERAAALSGWLERYNYRRRHGALGHRLRELQGNNVIGIYN